MRKLECTITRLQEVVPFRAQQIETDLNIEQYGAEDRPTYPIGRNSNLHNMQPNGRPHASTQNPISSGAQKEASEIKSTSSIELTFNFHYLERKRGRRAWLRITFKIMSGGIQLESSS